jgi:quercetin dioxygenase-like cupin family protein
MNPLALSVVTLLAADPTVGTASFGPRLGNQGSPKLAAGDAALYLATGKAFDSPARTAFTAFVLRGELRVHHAPLAAKTGEALFLGPSAKARPIELDGVALVLHVPVKEVPRTAKSVVTDLSKVVPLAIAGGKGTARILLDRGLSSDAAAAVTRLEFAAGAAVPPHQHEGAWELLYVVRGAGTLLAGDARLELKAEQAVAIPPGLKHAFTVTSPDGFEAVQLYAPPGPEQRFKVVPSPTPPH